jgi:hypothetical protein
MVVKIGYIEGLFMKVRLLILSILFANMNASEAPPALEPESAPLAKEIGSRPLLIFFDPLAIEDNPTNTISRDCGKSMKYKSAPILVSRNIWNILLSTPEPLSSFNESEWHVYTSHDESLLLFIPKIEPFESYMKKLTEFNLIHRGKKISDGELLLGMIINRLKKIDNPLALPHHKPKIFSDNLKEYFRSIMVTHAEIKHYGEEYLNSWDIFLFGHGLSSQTGLGLIAGMSIPSFESLLDFLNKNILTRTLYYMTCHAGGKNLKTPYEYKAGSVKEEQQEKDLNFIIIAGTTFDLEMGFTKSLNEDFGFGSYFKDLNDYFAGNKNKSLAAIIQQIKIGPMRFSFENTNNVLQVPTIRFPHTAWFKVTDIDKRITMLNNSAIMRAVNTGKNQITIPTQTNLVVLDARYVPISLIIDGPKMPLFIPHDVHQAPYFFKAITAPNINLIGGDTDIKTMLALLKLKIPSAGPLYIETLTVKLPYQQTLHGSLQWGNQPLTFNQVIIDPNNSIHLIYNKQTFTYNVKDNLWAPCPSYSLYFLERKEFIRAQSTLPKSMQTDSPKPVIPEPGKSRKQNDLSSAIIWVKEKKEKTGKTGWSPAKTKS